MNEKRIYLSPPDLGTLELEYVKEAFDTNWIAPLGPNVDRFEKEFCDVTNAKHALALSSGTAAIHLALRLLNIHPGDEVFVSDLTFVASANPILYEKGTPVFIDSERDSWNMDPNLLELALAERSKTNKLPKAVILVHLYGQPADVNKIKQITEQYEVPLIEDAAEALGSLYKGRHPGNDGIFGIYSFNGNKIITTSGGGMLVSPNGNFIDHARKLATQARDNAPWYQHSEVGFNYRLSNVCGGIGRGQLKLLDDRVKKRRQIFARYKEALGDLPGITFQPEAMWATHSRWLTCALINPTQAPVDRMTIIQQLAENNIESRPVWKPMHLQPLFEHCQCFGGNVAEELFNQGICLPSGSSLTNNEQYRIIEIITNLFK